MRAHGMRQGNVLALCVQEGRLQLRSDISLPDAPAPAAAANGRSTPGQARNPPKRRAAGAPSPGLFPLKRPKVGHHHRTRCWELLFVHYNCACCPRCRPAGLSVLCCAVRC